MAQSPIRAKVGSEGIAGGNHMARRPIWAQVGHEGIADSGSRMARRPIRAKVGRKASWTTSKYGTKANNARHRSHGQKVGHMGKRSEPPVIMVKRSEPPVIMGKGRHLRSSWAKGRNHRSVIMGKGRHGQRVGRARDRWTTSYGTQANLGKRYVAREIADHRNHGTKANTGKG